jgi:hypothetical protein
MPCQHTTQFWKHSKLTSELTHVRAHVLVGTDLKGGATVQGASMRSTWLLIVAVLFPADQRPIICARSAESIACSLGILGPILSICNQRDRVVVRDGTSPHDAYSQLRVAADLPRSGIQADREGGEDLVPYQRHGKNQAVARWRPLQGRRTGARRSTGSAGRSRRGASYSGRPEGIACGRD